MIPFVLAVTLTYVLLPVVEWGTRQGLTRTQAILILYLLMSLVFTGFLAYLIPSFARELYAFSASIPKYTRTIQELINVYQADYSKAPLPDTVRKAIDDMLLEGEVRLQNLIQRTIEESLAAFSVLISLVLAPILGFYFLRDLPRFRTTFVNLLPSKHKKPVLNMLSDMDYVLTAFIRGQLLIAFLVGTMVAVAMSLLGVRYSLLIGFIAGIFNIIPYVGPIVGAIPGVLLAALESPALVIKVIVAFVVIQQIDAVILSPKIMGDRLGLHPLLILSAVLTGGYHYGIFGALFAVPLVAFLRVLFSHIYQYLLKLKSI